jgi:hypothetical protein
MIDFIKRLFGFSAKPVEAAPSAPYKVPEPAATTPIPLVVTNSNPADNVPVAEKAPAKAPTRTAKPKAPAKAPVKAPAGTAKPKAPAKTPAKAPAKPKIKVVK